MSDALIKLANEDLDRVPQNHPVFKMGNLKHVQCPTVDIPVRADNNYKDCVTSVTKWNSKIIGVCGINAPKKLLCLCSDGVERPQLLKGKDDMRQDAVMEQVFGVVNQFLREDKETKKRHARVRTYKVVPLSRVSLTHLRLNICFNRFIPLTAIRNPRMVQQHHPHWVLLDRR